VYGLWRIKNVSYTRQKVFILKFPSTLTMPTAAIPSENRYFENHGYGNLSGLVSIRTVIWVIYTVIADNPHQRGCLLSKTKVR
jgi:hypothetical protein